MRDPLLVHRQAHVLMTTHRSLFYSWGAPTKVCAHIIVSVRINVRMISCLYKSYFSPLTPRMWQPYFMWFPSVLVVCHKCTLVFAFILTYTHTYTTRCRTVNWTKVIMCVSRLPIEYSRQKTVIITTSWFCSPLPTHSKSWGGLGWRCMDSEGAVGCRYPVS